MHDRVPRFIPLLAAVLGLACAPGCGSRDSNGTVLTVFAASSLTEAFGELEAGFEARSPTVDVRLSFAGSQVLRLQLEQGAAADVFASANEEHMRALVDDGLVSRSEIFAHNALVVVVPNEGSAVETFADLPLATRLVVGTSDVPVGMYTRLLLERAREPLGEDFVARVREHVVSEESNVRLARAKVELGEADAAIVYRTDAHASTRVRAIPVPEALEVRADYPIGPVARSTELALAERFIAFVRSPPGRRILDEHGFVTEVP